MALIVGTGGLLLAGAVPALGNGGSSTAAHRNAALNKDRIAAAYGRLPLAFEPNRGQTAAGVRYLAHGPGYGVFITADRTVLALAPRPAARGGRAPRAGRGLGAALSFRAIGARANPVVAGGGPLAGRVNYLTGRDRTGWRTNIPTYRQVTAQQVYPGVDLHWYGTQRGLEYDVVVAPNTDPGKTRLAIDGLRGRLRLTRDGDLMMPTAVGDVVQRAPHAYQVIHGTPHQVAAHFNVTGTNRVGFEVARYDHSQPLIIDPTLVYSTYLGGTGDDDGYGVAVDSSGNAYLTGDTASTDFPTTAGAFQTTSGGGLDAFVTKLNPTGTALIYSTYLGGSDFDRGSGIAVDPSGNAYLTGSTNSTDFPTTAGAFQTAFGGSQDGFVTKLNPTGTALIYSTYLGGSDLDLGSGIAVDSSGNASLTGLTNSTNFPTTAGAFQTTSGGGLDAFVTKLNPTGTALIYSTYLGGSGTDNGNGIALDSSGNASLTGFTDSTDFPTTAGAFQTTLGGSGDAFVTKLNPTGTALIYSTYLGGSGDDEGSGIAVDSAGNAYLTGLTASTNFPTTPGAFQTTFGGGFDAYMTKLNPTGTALIYSTYLGGSGFDQGVGIAVDSSGDAYLTGGTNSTDFPTTAGAFQTTSGGDFDAFMTKLNPTGSALIYSTYLGGSGTDVGLGIAVDSSGDAYLTGRTNSTDFPTTADAFQTTSGGGFDAFVTKFATITPTPTPRPPLHKKHKKHKPAPANSALGSNTDDAAVTGHIKSDPHTSSMSTSSSSTHNRAHHKQRHHKHRYRWHHRYE
jgi:hypothetical protein